MPANPVLEFNSAERSALVRVTPLKNATTIGYQIFDPETSMFICEGDWHPASSGETTIRIVLPPEKGYYDVYVSELDEQQQWNYTRGEPFTLIQAFVEGGRATLLQAGVTTLRRQRVRRLGGTLRKLWTYPVETLLRQRSLIRSMVRRDILARYRGSFGDVLWTVLQPLLLMATYFFVFSVVLPTRFGADNSRTGFVLYFLAGMLPWLAFSEAVGRAPHVLLEHRNFIKKTIFPVEILPVTPVFSGLVTQAFATGVFLIALLIIRGTLPVTALWAPVVLVPQVLFTIGTAWFLSALGVYVRDLSQVMGFVLTLWFFLTPICYPETLLPSGAAGILSKNPIYVLVRQYRRMLLEDSAPSLSAVWGLWLMGIIAFLLGYAWFHKLRKSFPDVI